MTKQEFEKGIGREVSERTFEVANAVYMSDRNEHMCKDSFYTLWKDQGKRGQMLMDYAADLMKENQEIKEALDERDREVVALIEDVTALKKENTQLKEENTQLKEENAQLKEENAQLKEARDAEAYSLIDESRDFDVVITKWTEDIQYETAVRLIGRREAVRYCLKKHYQLSVADERWLQEELNKNK